MESRISLIVFSIILLLVSCNENNTAKDSTSKNGRTKTGIELIVLGNVQDGGSPHIGCTKDCCKQLFQNPDPTRKVVSLGIIDHENHMTYMLEATPDFTTQMADLLSIANITDKKTTDGIFLTHAHIGHYTGLMYLGREALGAKETNVYAMPKMTEFLTNNGPWSQLVSLRNIDIIPIKENDTINLSENLSVIPFKVPHRDEFSETVGFYILGPSKKVMFIPDIDKWEKYSLNIEELISDVDYAFLDATFYSGKEINNRPIAEIPHPFVIESFERFKNLSTKDKAKIHFIHLNHTNPLLNYESEEYNETIKKGFNIATFHQIFEL
jgi:pyrroloquinoline quinone biosynthesis protein B